MCFKIPFSSFDPNKQSTQSSYKKKHHPPLRASVSIQLCHEISSFTVPIYPFEKTTTSTIPGPSNPPFLTDHKDTVLTNLSHKESQRMSNLYSRNSTRSRSTPTPCCSKVGIKRGPWTPEEDELLANYIKNDGEGRWRTLPKRAGLLRCGKSCRLRWMNYLRPSVKRGRIAPDEEDLILRLHRLLGNRYIFIKGFYRIN